MTAPRLALDFVGVPAANRVGRLLLCAGLGAAAVSALLLVPAIREQQMQREELGAVQVASAPRQMPTSPVPGMRTAQTLAAELNAPWARLLASIESIETKDVALLAVEPAAGRDSLQITANARHADAMLDVLAALRTQPLADVVLVSHQLQSNEPGTPIRFRMQARWGDLRRKTRAAPPLPERAPDSDSASAREDR